VLLLVVLGLLCCRRREPDRPALTPQQALSRTMQAAGSVSLTHLFELLDEKTRWSIMSVYKDQQKMCELIRTHYPKQVQARELRRCHLAASSRDVAAFFAANVKQDRGLIDPLLQFTAPGRQEGSGTKVELVSQGRRLAFCKEDGGWGYCGLRERVERLKVKSARDLTTVRENSESYR